MPITPPAPLNTGQVRQPYPSQMDSDIVIQPTFVLTTPVIPDLTQSPAPQDPTKPWMDREFQSQLPVVATARPVRYDTACPAFGFDSGFNISDLNASFAAPKSNPIKNVTVDTTSAAISGFGRVDLSLTVSDPAASCTIQIYQVDTVNGNVLIKQYDGVTRFNNSSMFVGGHDGIKLDGAPFVIKVSNITNGATVSVFALGR